MRIHIDITIFFSSGSAFGNVSGTVEVQAIPVIGDLLSFSLPDGVSACKMPPSFLGVAKVESRMFCVNDNSKLPSIILEGLVVDSIDEGRAISGYLEKAFGLFAVEYEQE